MHGIESLKEATVTKEEPQNIYTSNQKNLQANSASQKSPRIVVENPSLVQSSSIDKKVKHNVKNTYIKKINSLINITKAAEEGDLNRLGKYIIEIYLI